MLTHGPGSTHGEVRKMCKAKYEDISGQTFNSLTAIVWIAGNPVKVSIGGGNVNAAKIGPYV